MEELLNEINTWKQGKFIDQRQYSNMPNDWKKEREEDEKFLVRPSATGNAICKATSQELSEWIAKRLNYASDISDKIEVIINKNKSPMSRIKEIQELIK